MALNKLKKLIGNDEYIEEEDIKEEEYYKVSKEDYQDANGSSRK